jgi:Effector-associated domain 10
MKTLNDLKTILERISSGQHTEVDLDELRELMRQGDAQKLFSQYNIGQITGGDVQLGDRNSTAWSKR